LVAVVIGSAPAGPIGTGEDLIRAMHARYLGKWYRTLSFVQRAIFTDGRPEEEWWEAALIPGRLRIDIAPVDSGRTIVYRGDSSFSFNGGQLTRAAAGRNILAILGFDVYGQAPERTIALVRGEGFDLSAPVREETLNGVPAWVAGTGSHRFWIEKERLLFLKVLEPGPQGSATEISFDKYEKLGGGWIGTEVLFLRNGKEYFREIYRDWRINPAITEELFRVPPWTRAAWIPKP
jgi:hypothetical protein